MVKHSALAKQRRKEKMQWWSTFLQSKPCEIMSSIENQGLWEKGFEVAKSRGLQHALFYIKDLLSVIIQYVDSPEFINLDNKTMDIEYVQKCNRGYMGMTRVRFGQSAYTTVILLAEFESKCLVVYLSEPYGPLRDCQLRIYCIPKIDFLKWESCVGDWCCYFDVFERKSE
jgi:hypothetical protein